MALSGLDIYKLLPKTNCKECGFATCLAFAMALAQKKTSLDKCPRVTSQAREMLESASQPPIKLVTVGGAANKIEIGNETVMYRHEQKFFHPSALGVLLEDTIDDLSFEKAIKEINDLKFERVGQQISVDLVCVKNISGNKDKYASFVKRVVDSTQLNIALCSENAAVLNEALKITKAKRPLVIALSTAGIEEFINIAKDSGVPLAVTSSGLEEALALVEKAKKGGIEEIVLNLEADNISKRIQDFTFARRAALKKNFRPLGYPVMAITRSTQPELEMAEAISYIAKYAGIVIMKNFAKEFIFPVLVARQDIYQDPQKPVQVEPRIYEIGKVTKESPVLVTTNFSITYFTVAGEVESSKVPSYIISCDSEGMSVLTAWAADKFTAEKISETLKASGIADRVSHKKVVIPGYVSVLSGKLEEESGWKVFVGPKEASGITNFLRNYR